MIDWRKTFGESATFHVGISGGKDSTATLLWLVYESGVPREQIVASCADTEWEDHLTYEHINLLSERVHPITMLKPPLGFAQLARKKKGFPSKLRRFCTQELKMKTSKEFIDGLGDSVVIVSGVRADESEDRAKLPEVGPALDSYFGRPEWRPLLAWQIEDVFLIHRRYDIPLNPLYDMGAKRVGCFPCILGSKREIRLAARHRPEKIAEIRELERSIENPFGIATFFAANKTPPHFRTKEVTTKDGRKIMVPTIDDVVAWSQTKDRRAVGAAGQMAFDFWHRDEAPVCLSQYSACE